jgi:hypothetical protein
MMPELTAEQIDGRAAEIIEAESDLRARGDSGETFAALSLDEAKARLSGAADPFVGGFGWSLSAPPGGVILGRVSVNFPQPDAIPVESNIYVHVWVGSGNVDPDVGRFLLNVDPRFPRLAEPKVPGLQPGVSQVPDIPVFGDRSLLAFRLQVPFTVEPSVYLGNMCLMRRSPFSVGEVLGRAAFAFRVRGVDEPPDVNPSA